MTSTLPETMDKYFEHTERLYDVIMQEHSRISTGRLKRLSDAFESALNDITAIQPPSKRKLVAMTATVKTIYSIRNLNDNIKLVLSNAENKPDYNNLKRLISIAYNELLTTIERCRIKEGTPHEPMNNAITWLIEEICTIAEHLVDWKNITFHLVYHCKTGHIELLLWSNHCLLINKSLMLYLSEEMPVIANDATTLRIMKTGADL